MQVPRRAAAGQERRNRADRDQPDWKSIFRIDLKKDRLVVFEEISFGKGGGGKSSQVLRRVSDPPRRNAPNTSILGGGRQVPLQADGNIFNLAFPNPDKRPPEPPRESSNPDSGLERQAGKFDVLRLEPPFSPDNQNLPWVTAYNDLLRQALAVLLAPEDLNAFLSNDTANEVRQLQPADLAPQLRDRAEVTMKPLAAAIVALAMSLDVAAQTPPTIEETRKLGREAVQSGNVPPASAPSQMPTPPAQAPSLPEPSHALLPPVFPRPPEGVKMAPPTDAAYQEALRDYFAVFRVRPHPPPGRVRVATLLVTHHLLGRPVARRTRDVLRREAISGWTAQIARGGRSGSDRIRSVSLRREGAITSARRRHPGDIVRLLLPLLEVCYPVDTTF